MKKLLIVLMVVAMASFLFVGCIPGVTPDPDPDEDEDVAVTGVTLDQATLALTVGDAAVTLVATVAPATATDTRVIWASSDEMVAVVAAGVVTPLNAGISAITATTVDGGFVATCVVTVTAESEPTPVSTAPVIEAIDTDATFNLYTSDTQYMNKVDVDEGIFVEGFAPEYSEVNVYIGGVVVGTSTTYGVFEEFVVFVAGDDLGDDGAKTIYATATQLGLAESDPSTEYEFTLDTVAPEIEEVAASKVDETVTVTFNEALDGDTVSWPVVGSPWVGLDWTVDNLTTSNLNIWVDTAELTDDEVVELTVVALTGETVGNVILVTYKDAAPWPWSSPIRDLAGNPAVSPDDEWCTLGP